MNIKVKGPRVCYYCKEDIYEHNEHYTIMLRNPKEWVYLCCICEGNGLHKKGRVKQEDT